MQQDNGKTVKRKKRLPMSPERVFSMGFLGIILIGTLLLSLPIATVTRTPLSLFDALFTATSAVCVTGLVAVDTGTTFSAFGQAVLLLLIQVGGLGFMIFTSLLMSLLGRRISLRGKVLLRESMSGNSLDGLLHLTGVYSGIALGIEGIGALLLAVRFIPVYGAGKGIWYSVFHAVSAFCNAGFDLFGHFASLTGFRNDAWVLMVISVLIILGSIGFFVIFELLEEHFRWKELSLHTRLVLIASGLLLTVGTLLIALIEWNNPATLAQENSGFFSRLVNAFFQSVTMRTAGFNSVDLSAMHSGTKLICVMLMFVGASPASTGGGVKTTTVFVLLGVVISVIKGRRDTVLLRKRLPDGLAKRALAITMIYLTLVLGCTLFVSCMEGDRYALIDLLFENTSAIATVGVSAVGTPQLCLASRALLIPAMYLGRVGPMTLAMAFAAEMNKAEKRVRYPEENIMIG